MGKSFERKGSEFFDDMEYDEDFTPVHKSKGKNRDDKKLEIQHARKKAQAERDAAIADLTREVD